MGCKIFESLLLVDIHMVTKKEVVVYFGGVYM